MSKADKSKDQDPEPPLAPTPPPAAPPAKVAPPRNGPRVYRVTRGATVRIGDQIFPENAKVLIKDGAPDPGPNEPLVFDPEATKRQQDEFRYKADRARAKAKK